MHNTQPLLTHTCIYCPPPHTSFKMALGVHINRPFSFLLCTCIFISCCRKCRGSHHKSYDFTYGLEYENPIAVAASPEPYPAPQATIEKNASVQVSGTANIYVNPHEIECAEPSVAKESASSQSMQSIILKFGDPNFSEDSDSEASKKEDLTSL